MHFNNSYTETNPEITGYTIITMTKKEKVLACYGFVNMRSAAKLCDVTPAYVSVLWSREGFPYKEELRNNLKYPY